MKKRSDRTPDFEILFYKDSSGNVPVQQFIDSLDEREQAKMVAMIGYLQAYGFNAVRPNADILLDGIHELRTKITGDQVRTLYFFCYRNYIILTHSFIKRTNEVPEKEIRTAIHYREDFLKRFDTMGKLKDYK